MICIDLSMKDIPVDIKQCRKINSIEKEFIFTLDAIIKLLDINQRNKIINIIIKIKNEDDYKGYTNRLGSKAIIVEFHIASKIGLPEIYFMRFGLPKEKTIHHLYESIELNPNDKILFYKIINKFINKQENNIKYINDLLNQNNTIKRLNKKIKE